MKVNENGALTLDAVAGEAAVEQTAVEKEDQDYPVGDQAGYDLDDLCQKLEVITEAQLARLLKVKTQTLAVWRTDGSGPDYIKPTSKTVLYFREDVRRWFTCKVVKTNRTLGGSE